MEENKTQTQTDNTNAIAAGSLQTSVVAESIPEQKDDTQAVPAPVPASTPETDSPPVKSKLNLPKLKLKIPSIDFNSGNKKKIMIFAAVPIILVVLLLVASVVKGLIGNGGVPLPILTPTPTPTATPEQSPSPYAEDDVVLRIEEEVNKFDEKLNNAVLRDDTIRVPSLDWDINFK